MKEIKLETKCPKCEHVFLTTYEESEPAPPEAKFAEETANLEEEVASLKEDVARLESEEHSQEVIAHWLSQDFEDADPAVKANLGIKLGLDKMFREAGVDEAKEPALVAEVKESELPKIVYRDPSCDTYEKVQGLPIWLLKQSVD